LLKTGAPITGSGSTDWAKTGHGRLVARRLPRTAALRFDTEKYCIVDFAGSLEDV